MLHGRRFHVYDDNNDNNNHKLLQGRQWRRGPRARRTKIAGEPLLLYNIIYYILYIIITEQLYKTCFLHNLFFNELSEFGRNQSTPPTSLQTVSGKKTYGFGTAILFLYNNLYNSNQSYHESVQLKSQ